MADTLSLVRCIAKGDTGEVWVSRNVRPGGIDLRDAGDAALTEETVHGVDGDTAMVGTQLSIRALAQFTVDGRPWRTEIVNTDGPEPTYEQVLAFTQALAAALQ
jgi:hypothetical protein